MKKSIAKKITTLGIVGVMAIGQVTSALAASNFTISGPRTILSGKSSGYSIRAKSIATSTYSRFYLSIGIALRYKDAYGHPVYTPTKKNMSSTVVSSFTYEPTFGGTNVDESDFFEAKAWGYYRNGVSGNDNLFAENITTIN